VDNSDGTPLDLLDGKAGSLAAFVIAAYMKGVPMIYNGQEVGCPVKLNFFNNSTVIDWTINADITAEYKKLIAFRNNSDAIKKGSLLSYSNNDVCVFSKSINNEKVLVMVNLRNAIANYQVPQDLASASWKNAFDGSSVAVAGQLSLQPFEYKVLQGQ
jgi:glycosidase